MITCRRTSGATPTSSTARQLPVGRIGRPDDVAQALLFVLASGFVTGSVIECDDGARIAGR